MIGLRVKVINSSDNARNGTEGKILDESQNTFRLNAKGKEIIVPKKECEFEFDLGNDEKIIVKGKDILKKAENRIKEWKK